MRNKLWSLLIPFLVISLCLPYPAHALLQILNPDPLTLKGEYHYLDDETPETRLERQAAENLLLQHFGLDKVGFAPNSVRHPQSMFPLIYEAAERKLTADLGNTPSAAEIEGLLEQLAVDVNAREAFAPYLIGVALKALQVHPSQYHTYPAAKNLQEQFAVYYTNERRRSADRTYQQWELYRCGRLQGKSNAGLGALLTGSYISKKGFETLTDPYGLGALGAEKLKPYEQALHNRDPHSTALTPKDKGIIAAFSIGMPIASVNVTFVTSTLLTYAAMAAIYGTNAAVSGVTVSLSSSGYSALVGLTSGSVIAGPVIVGLMWVGAGMHFADVRNTTEWENELIEQREDTATQDPNLLYSRIQDAIAYNDEAFVGELLLIMLKMLVVEPARLARDTGGRSNVQLINGPPPPPGYGQEYTDTKQEPKLITLPDGSQALLRQWGSGPLDTTPEKVVTVDDSLDGKQIIIGCEASDPATPFASLPNFLDLYTDYDNIAYRRLIADPPTPSSPGPTGWIDLGHFANDVSVGADGAFWYVGTDSRPHGHSIFRRSGDTWEQIPGEAKRIAVGSRDHVAVVNSANNIFRWTGQGWERLPGAAHDIGMAPDGSLWVIGTDPRAGGFGIYRWQDNMWVNVPGGAVKVDVGPGNQALVTNDEGKIYRWSGAHWVEMPGLATDVAVGADGSMWCLGAMWETFGYSPYRWTGQDWQKYPGLGVHISAHDGNRIVLSNQSQQLFEGNF